MKYLNWISSSTDKLLTLNILFISILANFCVYKSSEKKEICWYFKIKYFDFFEIVFHFKIYFNYIKFITKKLFAQNKYIFLIFLDCKNFRFFSDWTVNLKLVILIRLVFVKEQILCMWVSDL